MRHLLVLMLFKTSLLFLLLSVNLHLCIWQTFLSKVTCIEFKAISIKTEFHSDCFLSFKRTFFVVFEVYRFTMNCCIQRRNAQFLQKFCFCFALKKKKGLEQHNFFCLMKTKQCRKWHTTLFQDGRICRINFAVQPDRLELGKPDGNDGWEINAPVKCMENACMSWHAK